jgi:tetratricopeptide (TPR) repeat protein
MGKAYQALGQQDAAIKSWQKSLDLQPGAAGIHLDLGNIYFEMDDFQKARQEWEIAFAGKPVDIPTHLMNMGMLYLQLEQYEMAIRAWQKASEIKPDDSNLHYHLALAYFKQEQYKDADLEVRECLRLEPDSPNAHLLLERIKQVQEGTFIPN